MVSNSTMTVSVWHFQILVMSQQLVMVLVRIMHLVVLVTPMVVVFQACMMLLAVIGNAATAAAVIMPADCCTSNMHICSA